MRPLYEKLYTVTELIAEAEYNGSPFFKPATKKFFGSRVYLGQLWNRISDPAIFFFITSEKRPGADMPRTWTVRQYNRTNGSIKTAGQFQAHKSLLAAKAATIFYSLTARAYLVGHMSQGDCPSCSGAANLHEPSCINHSGTMGDES